MESCGCGHRPKCHKRCVGEVVKKYKMYETCCYDMVEVCSACGYEHEYGRHRECPRCGEMVEPQFFGGFRGRGFGRLGRREFDEFREREVGERERESGEREREFGERRRFSDYD